MLYEIRKKLKENEFTLYWGRCLKYYREKDYHYREIVSPRERIRDFKVKTLGNCYSDKIIYHIKICDDTHVGFFGLYRFVLCGLYVADRLRALPFVSLGSMTYGDTKNAEEKNVFTYFWNQPCDLEYEKVCSAKNCIEYITEHRFWILDESLHDGFKESEYEINDLLLEEYARLRAKYLTYRMEIEEELCRDTDMLLSGKKTIAVHYRGTDFKVGFNGHPVALAEEDFYPYIDKCLENGYEQIFLATDDANALAKFQSQYGEKLVYYQDTLRSETQLGVHSQKSDRSGKRLAYEVLRDMFTLSMCDALVCGNSQVTYAARIEKKARGEEYAYLKVIDKGINSNDKEAWKRVSKYRKEYKNF